MTADYSDYQTPQAHADSIARTGAPLLNLHNQLIAPAGTVAPLGTQALGTVAFNQPSWFMSLALSIPATATKPVARLAMQWQDRVSFLNVSNDSWYLAAGNNTLTPNNYIGSGPAKGNLLAMTILNEDPAQILTYSMQLFAGSQVTAKPDIRSDSAFAFSMPGQNIPDFSDLATLFIGQRANATLAAGTGDGGKILPMYAGKAQLTATTSSNAADAVVSVTVVGVPGMSNSGIGSLLTDATGRLNAVITLPRAPCTVAIRNNNAAVQAVQWAVVAQDY